MTGEVGHGSIAAHSALLATFGWRRFIRRRSGRTGKGSIRKIGFRRSVGSSAGREGPRDGGGDAEGGDHRRRDVGHLHGREASGRGHRHVHDLREGRRGRRDVARQHLPGPASATCPSRFYTYSFRPNPAWSRFMPPGAGDPGLLPHRWPTSGSIRRHVRFGAEVTAARHRRRQVVDHHAAGEEAFDVLVTATGVLRVPRHPSHRRPRDVFGRDVPLRALGSFDPVARQADRTDRHGFHGRADHLGARREGCRRARRSSNARHSGCARRPNLRYRRYTKAALRRFPVLNAVRVHVLADYFDESVFGRAVVEPCWQRRLVARLCRWNLRMSVHDPGAAAQLTPTIRRCASGSGRRPLLPGDSAAGRRGRHRRDRPRRAARES